MRRVRVTNETEAAEAVRAAAADRTTLEIVGRATKRALGHPVFADAGLDMSGLTGILFYEPEELVIAARAGTRLVEIEAALAAKGQMLAFEPVDWAALYGGVPGQATLGGTIAANACGSRCVKAGAVRDHAIGCRFVNGRAEAVKAGGRVVKNVTGFDLTKLMCGAFGTLGALTELTFRTVPRPDRAPALVLRDIGPDDGLAALRLAAASPLEPTGLAYMPRGIRPEYGRGAAAIRVEGAAEAAAEKLALLREKFAGHETQILDDAEAGALFRDVGEGNFLADTETDIWRLAIPSSAASAAAREAGAALWLADCAGAVLWLGLPATEAVATRLRGIAARLGGHATLMRANEGARASLPVFQPEPAARASLTGSVKAAFDPLALFNPGRMYGNV